MSDTLTDAEVRAGIPEYPMERDPRCPFAPDMLEMGQAKPPSRVRIWDGSTPWLITGYEVARELFADSRVSVDDRRPGFPHWNGHMLSTVNKRPRSVFTSDAEEHTRFRRMLSKPFTFKRVEGLRPAIQEVTDECIDAILAGTQPADIVTKLALPVPTRVISEMLGVPYEDHEFFQHHANVGLARYASAEDGQKGAMSLAKDGLVDIGCGTAQQWFDLCAIIDHQEWIDEESPLSITQQANEKADDLYAWVESQTVDEIRDLATALRIPNAPVANGANIAGLDHFLERGSFVANPRDGFVQPGHPYRTRPAVLRAPEPSPRLGEHTDSYRQRDRRPPAVPTPSPKLPFEGLRVLDLTTFWAGPSCTHILAMLGADVIHVESTRRPDGTRMIAGIPVTEDQWWEKSPIFSGLNTNKKGLTLDLQSAAGRELVGRFIATCVVDAALNVAAEQVIEYSAYGVLLERAANRGPTAAPQNLYRTNEIDEFGRADCWVAVAVATDDQWLGLCDAVGRRDWASNAELSNAEGRRTHHDTIDEHLAAWCETRSGDEIVDALWEHGVPVGKVTQPHRQTELPQLAARRFFEDVGHPVNARTRHSTLPFRFSRGPERVHVQSAPLLGQHNHELLSGLGLTDDEIAELEAQGVIGSSPTMHGTSKASTG